MTNITHRDYLLVNPTQIPKHLENLEHAEELCRHSNPSIFTQFNAASNASSSTSPNTDHTQNQPCSNTDLFSNLLDKTNNYNKYFVLFFISNFINGIASTPIFTLGTSFLFDNMPSASAPMYVGILYLTGAVGPAIGYLLCGFILKIYVDPWLPSELSPSDPNYVGAWWLGFVIFGIFIMFSSLALFGYPKVLPKRPQDTRPKKKFNPGPPKSLSSNQAKEIENRQLLAVHSNSNSPIDEQIMNNSTSTLQNLDHDANLQSSSSNNPTTTSTTNTEGSDVALLNNSSSLITDDDARSIDTQISMNFGNTMSDMPLTIWSLIKNKVFLFVTLSASCEFTIITAFMTFIPKYLEAQFSLAASTAALLCGSVLVPSAGVGILLGSFLVKQLNLNRTGCVKLACCSCIIAICLFIPTLFIYCDSLDIAGINVPYPNLRENLEGSEGSATSLTGHRPAINSTCNLDCGCSRPANFDPVCWEEREITFFNPCLAGCTESQKLNKTDFDLIDRYEFSKCSCLKDETVTGGGFGELLLII